MKNSIMKIALMLCVICGFAFSAFAQTFTLKGVVYNENREPILGAVVYQKWTAGLGVPSDPNGRFSINTAIDSTLVIGYVGHEKQEVKITSEKELVVILKFNDLQYANDITIGAKFIGLEEWGNKNKLANKNKEEDKSHLFKIKSGLLTAGELNDFAKWDQWESTLTKDFAPYWKIWNYRPLDRYTTQVTNKKGMPMVNVKVSLLDEYSHLIWKTRTDNTGKAELWSNIFTQEKATEKRFKLVFDYDGTQTEVTNVKTFSEGINSLQIDAECKVPKKVDIFFILDNSGSMTDEMDYLKVEIEDVVTRVRKEYNDLQLRLGSLVYRDYKDEYLSRKSSLDSDVSKSIAFIKQQEAKGGDDYPEAMDEALYQVINEENWDDEAVARIAFLFLDAPSHISPDVISRLTQQISIAAEKGIRIVPIVCSGAKKDAEYLMRCMALATNGTCVFLTDHSGMGDVHIEPTTDKYDVEKLHDTMTRIIKQFTKMPECNNKVWIKENKKESLTDKFVPNPYDEQPEEESMNIDSNDIMKLYPNPCRDILKVEVKKEIQDLYFVDMTGKTLNNFRTKKNDIVQIDVQNLATGIYFVKAYYKGRWFAEKIIVTK